MISSESNKIKKHIENVKCWPRKSGKSDYLRYLRGERLNRSESIRAHCYCCVGGESIDKCLVETCSLLPYSPYRAAK